MSSLLRRRYLILTAATAGYAAWLAVYLHTAYQQDYYIGVYGGWALFGWVPTFHHSGLHLYAEWPQIQIGPLALVVVGLLAKLPGDSGRVVMQVLVPFLGLLCVWAVERTVVLLGAPKRRAAVSCALLAVPVVALFGTAAAYAHLEDALAVTLMLLAVAAIAGHGRWWVPAVLLGAGMLLKPWSVVWLPLVFAVDRERIRAFGVAIGVAAAGWLPFVIGDTGTVRALASLPSRVMHHSALGALRLRVDSTAPSGIRALAMLLGICLAGFAVARGQWLLAPLAGEAGRLLLEPRWFIYYGVGVLAAAVLLDVSRRGLPIWTLWALVTQFAVQAWAPPIVGAAAQVLFVLTVMVTLVISPRNQRAPAVAARSPLSMHPVELSTLPGR